MGLIPALIVGALACLFMLVWLYLIVTGGMALYKATQLPAEEAPSSNGWIVFGLSFGGLFAGVLFNIGSAIAKMFMLKDITEMTEGDILLGAAAGRTNTAVFTMVGIMMALLCTIYGIGFMQILAG